MKAFSLLIFLLLFNQFGFSQSEETIRIDSLKNLLRSEKQDTSKCMLLVSLCWEYLYSKPDTALALAQQGLELAKRAKFTKGEAFCISDIGFVLCEKGNNAQALQLQLQALKKSETVNSPALSVNIYVGIAHVYTSENDFRKALEYDLLAMSVANGAHDDYLIMRCANSIGGLYSALNILDSAKFFDEQAYDLAAKIKDDDFTGVILSNLGYVHSSMGQNAIAMDYYRSALLFLLATEDNSVFCFTYLSMASLFQKQNAIDSSLYYAYRSLHIAQQNGYVNSVLDAANFLADYYKKHQVTDSAYAYLQMVISAKDTLFSQEKTRTLQNLSFNETLRQMDIATAKKEKEQEHKNNLEILFITAALIALIGLFFALSRSFIVHERWIKFLGILGLLVTFEYIYILIDPLVIRVTNESPLWMLLLLIVIALILEPIHNRIEHWITHKVIEKNKQLRLAAAKKTVARLETQIIPGQPKED